MSKYLFLNNKISIKSLKNKRKYIFIEKNKIYYPIFLSKDSIRILELVENNVSYDELIKKFHNSEQLKILIKNNFILTEENNLNKDIALSDKILFINKYKFSELTLSTRTPINVHIELTYNCNYMCKHCYIEGMKSNFMKFETVIQILDILKKNGTVFVTFTGGEPLLHPKIIDILKYASKKGFYISVLTNASLINYKNIKEFIKINNLHFEISFHSINKKVFDSFTGVKNSLDITLNVFDLLINNKVEFIAKVPVTRYNQSTIKETIQFLIDNNIKFKANVQILPHINDKKDLGKFFIDQEIIRWLYKCGHIKFQKSICVAAKTKLWISPNCDVYPCELIRYSIGNFIEDSFDDIWYGEKVKFILNSNLYIENEQCKVCIYRKYCNNCNAYFKYEKSKKNFKQFCIIAKSIKSLDLIKSKDD